MTELSLIKLCLKHADWASAKDDGLSTSTFPNKELGILFSVLDNFHATHSEDLTVADLGNLVFASVSKDQPFYAQTLATLDDLDVSTSTSKILLASMVRKAQLQQISVAAYEAYEGKDKDGRLEALLEAYRALPEGDNSDEDFEFVSDSLSELVDKAVKTPGLRWRLSTLNRSLGSLRTGNFGFVFARPETGKTTFLASEVTFMCEQLPAEAGPIIWLANEEPGANVKLRIYQAWFGITLEQLLSDVPKWEQLFIKQSRGKLKVLDRATISKETVAKLCKQFNPSLLVVDQIDKITGFNNDRDDLRLGSIYQWFREIAKQYCPVIGICQADGTGEGVKWLTMGHVSNAKTAKQAEADWILGIGKQNADGYESIRYLHLSKNKLLGDADTEPELRHGKVEVLIEPQFARYKDLF